MVLVPLCELILMPFVVPFFFFASPSPPPPLKKRHYEPLISDAVNDEQDELLFLADDPLSAWLDYVKAVQDQLPADQQVRCFFVRDSCQFKVHTIAKMPKRGVFKHDDMSFLLLCAHDDLQGLGV